MLVLRNRITSEAANQSVLQEKAMLAPALTQAQLKQQAGNRQNIYWWGNADTQIKDAPGGTVRVSLNSADDAMKSDEQFEAKLKQYEAAAKKYGKRMIVAEWKGKGENVDKSNPINAARRWVKMKSFFDRNPSAILNIMNEWGPRDANPVWRDAYKEAGKIIRDAGINNEIMIDAGGNGQNPANIITYGKEVADHIGGKVSFSVHTYGNWRDSKNVAGSGMDGKFDIKTEITRMKNATRRPIWIGEWGRVDLANENPRYTPAQLRADAQAAGAAGTLLWGWKTT